LVGAIAAIGGISVLPAAASATGKGHALRLCVCAYFTVPLAATTVRGYNASSYSSAALTTLVQLADRGMDTQDPQDNDVPGEMHAGDLVVVTEYGLYWIDATTRGGLLSGEWPLYDYRTGINFRYIVGSHNWAPNLLLPGSNGSNAAADEGDEGLGIRVIPEGGRDATTATGEGTFDPHGVAILRSTKNDAYEIAFTFQGTLTQEYNGTSTLIDDMGDTTQIAYAITYTFFDANDPNTTRVRLLTKRPISIRYINRIDVALTPVNTAGNCQVHHLHCIHLGVLGIGDDLRFISATQTPTVFSMKSEDDTLGNYVPPGCSGGGNHARRTFVALCTTTPAGDQDFIQQPTALPVTLRAGDTTEFCTAACVRSLIYIHPPGFTLPARDAAIYNQALGVIAVETQYFNTIDPPPTWSNGRTFRTGEDQLIQSFADAGGT